MWKRTFVETVVTVRFTLVERLLFEWDTVFRVLFLVLIRTEFEDASTDFGFLEDRFGFFGRVVHVVWGLGILSMREKAGYVY